MSQSSIDVIFHSSGGAEISRELYQEKEQSVLATLVSVKYNWGPGVLAGLL